MDQIFIFVFTRDWEKIDFYIGPILLIGFITILTTLVTWRLLKIHDYSISLKLIVYSGQIGLFYS